MERWSGKVAIVTGASSGIGEAIARILVQNGLKVVGVARRLDRLQAIAEELKCCKGQLYPAQCDISQESEILRVMQFTKEKLGGVNVLVNNAGIAPMCPLEKFSSDDLRKIYDVNVIGLCLFTREVVKDMKERGINDGHIFHISSVSGTRIVDFPGVYPYAASKHAVGVLTEGLRRELRDLGTQIRVTNISPGFVKTEIFEVSGHSEEMFNHFLNTNPYLQPSDVAESLIFALSRPQHVQIHQLTIQPTGEKF